MCSILVDVSGALQALPRAGEMESAELQARAIELRSLAERAHVLYLEDVAVLESRARRGEDPVGIVMREVGLPGRVARAEAGLARALHLPDERQCAATAALLRDGALSLDQARSIQRAMNTLLPSEVADVEPLVARLCAEHPPAATDQICRNARTLAPHQRPDARDARAHAARGLRIVEFADHVKIDGQVPIPAGALLVAAVDAFAAPVGENDPRTYAQRQADGLVELARRQLATGDAPVGAGVRPHVHLTIDINDLLATDAGSRGGMIGDRIGAGIGSRAARQLSCDAVLDATVLARPDSAAAFREHRIDSTAGSADLPWIRTPTQQIELRRCSETSRPRWAARRPTCSTPGGRPGS